MSSPRIPLELVVSVAEIDSAKEPVPVVVRMERMGEIQQAAKRDPAIVESSQELEMVMDAPGVARIDLEAASIWRVRLEAPGLWAPPVVWRSNGTSRVEIQAVRTGNVTGTFVLTASNESLENLSARFQPVGGSIEDPTERHEVDCRIALNDDHRSGTFVCPIPSGRFDIRLRAPGYVSHYFWDLTIVPGGEVDLGQVHLDSGASVVTWIVSEGAESDFDVTQASAELWPEAAGADHIARDRERRRLLRHESSPNEHGFVQFVGLSPGTYRLRVSHPDLATATFAPLTVVPGAETELRRIVMRPPARLLVELDPPVDSRKRPWLLTLSRHGAVPGQLDRVAEGAAQPDGRWERTQLDPGHYRLVVSDGRGSRWESHEIELASGDRTLHMDLPFERVEARVTLGGQPLAGATLWFGGRNGTTRISAVSDEEGAIYVFLPVRDAWPVEVRADVPPLLAKLDALEVREHPTQPWKLVEIDLPETGIAGEVKLETGGPVVGATIRLMREESPPRFFVEPTEDDGSFLVRALKPGTWRVQAEWIDEGQRWISDGVLVSIVEEQVERVELVLRRPWRFSGQIVGPSGSPVFGAEVIGLPVYPGGGERATYVDSAITGLSGEFDLQVPAEATAVRLTVLPPGYSARRWAPFERGTPPQVLAVDRYGGTLKILGVPARSSTAITELPGVFGPDLWGLSLLRRWALIAGAGIFDDGTLTVPQMPPGLYFVCPAGTSSADRRAGACDSGELLPYAELELSVPSR